MPFPPSLLISSPKGQLKAYDKLFGNTPDAIFGGAERLARLKDCCSRLSVGAKLFVASHGITDVVRTAMERCDLLPFFEVVAGSDSGISQEMGGSKVSG